MKNVRFLAFCAPFVLCGSQTATYAKDVVIVISDERRVEQPLSSQFKPRAREDGTQIPLGDLKEYGFWVKGERFGPAADALTASSHSTKLYAWYETTGIRDIESYAFVQFVRGCIFASQLGPDDKEERALSVTRNKHFGERIVYVHPNWEIDSDDGSPIFGSTKEKPLLPHYGMQWGIDRQKFPSAEYKLYGEDPPKIPRLFMDTRLPMSAHVQHLGDTTLAINHALEFRTCLYRTKDIPGKVDKTQSIRDPIDCVSWRSSFIFDHHKKVFESPKEIPAICRPDVRPMLDKGWEWKK